MQQITQSAAQHHSISVVGGGGEVRVSLQSTMILHTPQHIQSVQFSVREHEPINERTVVITDTANCVCVMLLQASDKAKNWRHSFSRWTYNRWVTLRINDTVTSDWRPGFIFSLGWRITVASFISSNPQKETSDVTVIVTYSDPWALQNYRDFTQVLLESTTACRKKNWKYSDPILK